jgi:ribosomal protein RSM22 (predicted rRNA methylase)
MNVQLPITVRRHIEDRAESVGFSELKRAATELSAAYREGRPIRLKDKASVAAYLVTRMPATYAAAHAVLREVRARVTNVASILDVGAGTGAASLAALEHFPNAAVTLVEREPALIEIAREWLPGGAAMASNIAGIHSLPQHDLVIAAYSLGEFGAALTPMLWQAARVALVVIEPGTPRGFALIRGIRDNLLSRGAHMLAPCPMENACPLADPDWCHFAARVERSSLHRRIKGADLGYEDEKFSYVAVTREPVGLAASRIIRRPRQDPGLIVLETCTPDGTATVQVTKRNRDSFRAARKADWGDVWT